MEKNNVVCDGKGGIVLRVPEWMSKETMDEYEKLRDMDVCDMRDYHSMRWSAHDQGMSYLVALKANQYYYIREYEGMLSKFYYVPECAGKY
jgi:hypothetical protein